MKRKQVMQNIIKTSDAIRKKYQALKRGKIDFEDDVSRTLKPIINPLQEIAEKIKSEKFLEKSDTEEKLISDDDDEENNDEQQSNIIDKSKKNENISQIISTSTPYRQIRQKIKNKRLLSLQQQQQQQLQKSSLQNLNENEENINNEEIYESPTALETSMQNLVNNPKEFQTLDQYLDENVGPTLKAYMLEFFKDPDKTIDKTFGPHYENENLMLGCKTFDVKKNDSIIIGNKNYKATPGLLELIFKKNPNDILYNNYDLKKYKEILEQTNVYRKSYTKTGQIKSSKSNKYKYIISKLINKSGQGYKKNKRLNDKKEKIFKSLNMSVTNNIPDYKYYNNINELVERLKLLISAKLAGNNNQNNEILEIIEELVTRGYVTNKNDLHLDL